MSSYSTDYSRFKDIVDSDEEAEEKPGADEEEEAAGADDAASASGSDSDSLPDLLEGDEAEDPAVEAAAAQWCAPAVAAEPLPPPAPEPAADGAMPSWMAPADEEVPSSTPVVEPAEAADDAAPVPPDEEDSPAFTDDEDDPSPLMTPKLQAWRVHLPRSRSYGRSRYTHLRFQRNSLLPQETASGATDGASCQDPRCAS